MCRRSVSPHARYSPNFPYRRFCTLVWFHAPSFRVGLMFSSYELRFVFPSWLARASVYFPFTSPPPFPLSFPPVSLSPLTCTFSLLTNFATKKITINQIPYYSFLSRHLSHTNTHSLTKHHPHSFFVYIIFTFRVNAFSPSNHNVLPCSLFFSLSGAISIFFLLLTLLHINPSHCEQTHFPFPFFTNSQQSLCHISLSM